MLSLQGKYAIRHCIYDLELFVSENSYIETSILNSKIFSSYFEALEYQKEEDLSTDEFTVIKIAHSEEFEDEDEGYFPVYNRSKWDREDLFGSPIKE